MGPRRGFREVANVTPARLQHALAKRHRPNLDGWSSIPFPFPVSPSQKETWAAANLQTLLQRMPSAEEEPQANPDPLGWQPALPPGATSRLQAEERYECKRLGAQLCLLQRRLLEFGLLRSLKAQPPSPDTTEFAICCMVIDFAGFQFHLTGQCLSAKPSLDIGSFE